MEEGVVGGAMTGVAPEGRRQSGAGRLGAAVRRRLAALDGDRRDVDLVVMANEISFAHGTGVLMSRILEEAPPFVLFRAFDHWGGAQVISPAGDFVLHQFGQPREVIADFIAARLGAYRVGHIVSIPYTREDVVMTLTAKAMSGSPLVAWIMDDNSVLNDGIPAHLMSELVEAADARFVISDAMREVYEAHYNRPFWVLPPLVARKFLRDSPSAPPAICKRDNASDGQRPDGCIVGNIWHQAWLEQMLLGLEGLELNIEWYTSSNDLHFLSFTAEDLARSGVTICSDLSHAEIAARIEASRFVLVPSSSGNETDSHAAAIGRLSLPSKMPFNTATAGVPFLVLANCKSGAGDYVRQFGLGEVVNYRPEAIAAAVARLSNHETQDRIRRASFALCSVLDVTGLYDFLLSAARERRLPDDRFEKTFSSISLAGRSATGSRLQANEETVD